MKSIDQSSTVRAAYYAARRRCRNALRKAQDALAREQEDWSLDAALAAWGDDGGRNVD